ncbi:hypothetical protein DL98DRAFT_179716 [Cadophora sp. DSE1049]|nr:hypothetical protein DL98DRAFT_179716 [Cadophora sp. DSE1049]
MTSGPHNTQSDNERSSSDSASSGLSLEEAVQRYPTQAVEKVATVLGLIKENFERVSTITSTYREATVAARKPTYGRRKATEITIATLPSSSKTKPHSFSTHAGLEIRFT